MSTLYDRLIELLGPLVRRYARLQVHGLGHLPAPGRGALLACNHSGSLWWDACCLAAAIRERRVHFIAHHWDARIKPLRWILRRLDSYFLDPTLADIHACGEIVAALRGGEITCIYPEESYHTFRDRYTLFSFAPHALEYARLADVPIVPVAVIGAEEAAPTFFGPKLRGVPLHVPLHPPVIMPFKVTIEIGPPLRFESLARDGDCARGAMTLRARLREMIEPYRRCRVSDEKYLERRSWY